MGTEQKYLIRDRETGLFFKSEGLPNQAANWVPRSFADRLEASDAIRILRNLEGDRYVCHRVPETWKPNREGFFEKFISLFI
jgi:hypothetical protein